jgi:hypothetical protein
MLVSDLTKEKVEPESCSGVDVTPLRDSGNTDERMKTCTKCNTRRPLLDFWKSKRHKDGYMYACKFCATDYNKKERKNRNDYDNMKSVFYKYGLTKDQYLEMLVSQKHVCAICGGTEYVVDKRTGKIRRLHVDHCHKTGKIRGLLCQKCNQAIGLLGDTSILVLKAAAYLQVNETKD